MLKKLVGTLTLVGLFGCGQNTETSTIKAVRNSGTSLDVIEKADFAKLPGFIGVSEELLVQPGSITPQKPKGVAQVLTVSVDVQDTVAFSENLKALQIKGRIIAENRVTVETSLMRILKISSFTSTKKLSLSSAGERSAEGKLIGLLVSPQFQSLSDSTTKPIIQTAAYKKMSQDLVALIEASLAANLETTFNGFVRFSQAISQDDAQRILPGVNVIAGEIGTFRNLKLADLLKASANPKIANFQKPVRTYPNPAMGVGN